MSEQARFDFGDVAEAQASLPVPVSKMDGSGIKKRGLDDDDHLWTSHGLFGDSISDLFGSGSRIGLRSAFEQSVFMACCDVLAQDIAKAKLRLMRKIRGGGVDEVEPSKHRVARLLALDPNNWHTWPEFTSMMIYNFVIFSNSYAYVRRDRKDDILELIPLIPSQVTDRVNHGSREVFYDISAGTRHEAGLLGFNSVTAPERNVIHVRNRMLDGFFGYATLTAGNGVLQKGKALNEYERKLFDKDAMIKGYFVRDKDKPISAHDDAFRRLQSQLQKVYKRFSDDGVPPLIEEGIQFVQLAMKAQEAEMSKSIQNQVEQICQLFRMPPHKIMHFASVKYENLATMEQQYAKNTLYPICELFEARLSRTLLTEEERFEYFFEFDREAMSMADEQQHREWVKMLLYSGAISIDEARKEGSWNPKPGKNGKAYIIPVNTVIVDEQNNVIVSGAKEQGSGGDNAGSGDSGDAKDDEKEKTALRLVK